MHALGSETANLSRTRIRSRKRKRTVDRPTVVNSPCRAQSRPPRRRPGTCAPASCRDVGLTAMPTEASPRAAKEGRHTDGSSGSRRAARPPSRRAPASRAAAAVARVLHAQAAQPSENGTRVTDLRAATCRPPQQTTPRQPESGGVRCRAGGSVRGVRMMRRPPLPAPAFRTPHGLPAFPIRLCPPLPNTAPPPLRAPAMSCREVPNSCRPRAAAHSCPFHHLLSPRRDMARTFPLRAVHRRSFLLTAGTGTGTDTGTGRRQGGHALEERSLRPPRMRVLAPERSRDSAPQRLSDRSRLLSCWCQTCGAVESKSEGGRRRGERPGGLWGAALPRMAGAPIVLPSPAPHSPPHLPRLTKP